MMPRKPRKALPLVPRLRVLRWLAQLPLERLAYQVGTSTTTLRRIESGLQKPDPVTAVLICGFFSGDYDAVFGPPIEAQRLVDALRPVLNNG
jgi:DNA-binding XRE family transcriptional regulator